MTNNSTFNKAIRSVWKIAEVKLLDKKKLLNCVSRSAFVKSRLISDDLVAIQSKVNFCINNFMQDFILLELSDGKTRRM